MSRKYSSWASNQTLTNSDFTLKKLNTVIGNEQDQLKVLERVEAIPHMYINVDAPPPMTKDDARAIQPAMMSRQSSAYFAVPGGLPSSTHTQMKIWPTEKSSKNPSSFESASSTSKRPHKHKHRHHRHHHHHHHNHSRKHRAKSAESIRNRQHQAVISPTKMIITNPSYIEQDQLQQQQQQQQQQPMIVYREVANGEGYTVDPNGLATVPYGLENETGIVDDQQAPMIVYREHPTSQQSIITDGLTQQMFYNPEQETIRASKTIPLQSIEKQVISHRVAPVNESHVGHYAPSICQPVMTGCIQEIERIYIEDDCCAQTCIVQQSDPFACLPQQQSSQIVYCTDPNHQDYLCASAHHNIIQQSISPSVQQQQQQQFVCLENTPTIQPTMINQIPVFNTLSTNTSCPSVVNFSQPSIQRAASVVIQQPQAQPLQIIQQPQPLQMLQQQQQQPLQMLQQQQQPLQVLQQHQPLQVIQQPQQLQIIQTPQPQAGQLIQIAPNVVPQILQTVQSSSPQVLQTIQPPPPQVIQGQSVLQTIQVPTQTIAGSPQILYQRPYDPVMVPIQNQQVAIGQPPLVALSQPSYAPSRVISAAIGGGGGAGGVGGVGVQSAGPNMFRHALLRTVADRTGVPLGGSTAGIQLMQPTAVAPIASTSNLVLAGGLQRSASLPIVPLTPGGLLIPFQPAPERGLKPGALLRSGGYPSTLRNFDDIRRQIQARQALLLQNLERQENSQIPSPPVLSAAPRTASTPYISGNIFPSTTGGTGPYSRTAPTVLPYSQPSYIGSPSASVTSTPYRPLRP